MPKLSKDALLRFAKDGVKKSRDASSDWREEARNAFELVAGHQWTQADRKLLEKPTKRPVVTFNRIDPMIEAVVGMEINNRQEIHFRPREPNDQGTASVYNATSKWIDDVADTEDEDSEAFRNLLICGMGWEEESVDFDQDPDGLILSHADDPLAFFWDPGAHKPNLVDARWVARIKRFSKEVFAEEFPEAVEAGIEGRAHIFGMREDEDTVLGKPQDTPDYVDNTGDVIDKADADVLVLEFEYWAYDTIYRLPDPATGALLAIPPDRFRDLENDFKERGIILEDATGLDSEEMALIASQASVLPYITQREKVFYRAFFTGDDLIPETHESNPDPKSFSMKCITGRWDRKKRMFYGIVRSLDDPQRFMNKFISTFIYQYMTSPKGMVLYDKNAVENPNEFARQWARPSGSYGVNGEQVPNGIANAFWSPPPSQLPSQAPLLLQFVIDALHSTSGINIETMGLANRDQPNILEVQRKQSSMTILASMFNNYRRFRKAKARTRLVLIRDYIPADRIVQIVGDDMAPFVEAAKQVDLRYLNLKVDDNPQSPSMQAFTFFMMQQIMQFAPDLAPVLVPILIEFSPLPIAAKMKVQQSITQAQQPDTDSELFKAQEFRKGEAEIEKDEADAALKRAKAEAEGEKVDVNEVNATAQMMKAFNDARKQDDDRAQ